MEGGMSSTWRPPLPALPERERDELCQRCGKRRGEHEGIGAEQWCRGSGRNRVFRASGQFQELGGQGQLGLRVEAA